jgi:ElaB/YqjD/DUF883 family membrane-anchored ribosome-binding protein
MKTDNDNMEKIRAEIDHLAVQFALGKAEVKDQLETLKKDFNSILGQWKVDLGSTSTGVLRKIQELEVQLALGKAESQQLLEEQLKKIRTIIAELEVELKQYAKSPNVEGIKQDIAQLKLKLEILKLKLKAKSGEYDNKIREGLKSSIKSIDDLITDAQTNWNKSKEPFKEKIGSAFDHLKKAVQSLVD